MWWSADPKTRSNPLLNKVLSKAFSSTSFRISSSFSIESRARVNDDRSPLPALRATSRASSIPDLLIVISETSIEGEKAQTTVMVLANTSSVALRVEERRRWKPWPIIAAGATQRRSRSLVKRREILPALVGRLLRSWRAAASTGVLSRGAGRCSRAGATSCGDEDRGSVRGWQRGAESCGWIRCTTFSGHSSHDVFGKTRKYFRR